MGPYEVGVVRRCGRLDTVLSPGLHWRFLPPWDEVTRVEPGRTRTVMIGGPGDETKQATIEWNTPHRPVSEESTIAHTGDQNLIEFSAYIQYRVLDPARFVACSSGQSDGR